MPLSFSDFPLSPSSFPLFWSLSPLIQLGSLGECCKLWQIPDAKRFFACLMSKSEYFQTVICNIIFCFNNNFAVTDKRNRTNLLQIDLPHKRFNGAFAPKLVWCTPLAIKTCHFVFRHNSDVSLSIFTFFCNSEYRKNTLLNLIKIYHLTLTMSRLYLVKQETT